MAHKAHTPPPLLQPQSVVLNVLIVDVERNPPLCQPQHPLDVYFRNLFERTRLCVHKKGEGIDLFHPSKLLKIIKRFGVGFYA